VILLASMKSQDPLVTTLMVGTVEDDIRGQAAGFMLPTPTSSTGSPGW
jgi:hypothetical protein